MKRALKFGIFGRSKEEAAPEGEPAQTEVKSLYDQLHDRTIELAEGDVWPPDGMPPLDWGKVAGRITVPAGAVTGILEGRTLIDAKTLKTLNPAPVGADIDDATQYSIELSSVVPQIQDLLGPVEEDDGPPPAFLTAFTMLAQEDSLRLEVQKHGKEDGVDPAKEIPGEGETKKDDQPAKRRLSFRPVRTRAEDSPPPLPPSDHKDTASHEVTIDPPHPIEPLLAFHSGTPPVGEADESLANDHANNAQGKLADIPRRRFVEEPGSQGLERLQEIFMTSEPLPGPRVASLIQKYPGVTGALIMLEGAGVLGGEIPEQLNLDAALQAAEVCKKVDRFLRAVEGGKQGKETFITVTSSMTISLTLSGRIVLFVSHQGRKLPPGLAQRLTAIAEALNLIYVTN
jgi:hypothetical protein